MMNRRELLLGLAGAACVLPRAVRAATGTSRGVSLGVTWRGPAENSGYEAGALRFNSEARTLDIAWSQPLPSRAHGLLAEADGSLLIVAVRPGYWIHRYSRAGVMTTSVDTSAETGRYLTGHVIASMDGQHLFTGETDPRDDSGWISVRDSRSLQRVAQWPTHGIEPHDLKLDASGALLVANGGIRRARNDRKRDLDRMQSSLARFDSDSGELLGQWQLQDARLSLRHMAWEIASGEQQPLLGIGLQAEHDSDIARREAPVLAVWDGHDLTIPGYAADAAGYAGDITPAASGGFVLSSNKVNSAFWWRPADPTRLTLIAQLTEAYALTTSRTPVPDRDVVICAARGAALWNPHRPAALLPWPKPMVLENHWTALTT